MPTDSCLLKQSPLNNLSSRKIQRECSNHTRERNSQIKQHCHPSLQSIYSTRHLSSIHNFVWSQPPTYKEQSLKMSSKICYHTSVTHPTLIAIMTGWTTYSVAISYPLSASSSHLVDKPDIFKGPVTCTRWLPVWVKCLYRRAQRQHNKLDFRCFLSCGINTNPHACNIHTLSLKYN